MSQHIKLTESNEPKIFKSVRRIAEYYVRASRYITRYTEDYGEEFIYKKNVIKLPDRYKLNKKTHTVLKIGKYGLENSNWWEIPTDRFLTNILKEKYSSLDVECHIDDKGQVISIYVND